MFSEFYGIGHSLIITDLKEVYYNNQEITDKDQILEIMEKLDYDDDFVFEGTSLRKFLEPKCVCFMNIQSLDYSRVFGKFLYDGKLDNSAALTELLTNLE